MLVIGGPLVFEDAHGDGFTQFERLHRVGTPMDSSDVAANSNIRGQFVQLSTHRQCAAGIWLQRQPVRSRLNWIWNDVRLIEPRLQNRHTSPGYRGMARTVRG